MGTAPIVVNDISDHDKIRLLEYKVKCLKDENIELLALKERDINNLKSQLASKLDKVSNQSDNKPNFKKTRKNNNNKYNVLRSALKLL